MKIKRYCTSFIMMTAFLVLVSGCAKKESSSATTSSSDNSTTSFVVSEITQTLGDDGYYTGSFVIPSNGISFILSVFKDNNGSTAFHSLFDPDNTDILSTSSTPTLNGAASGSTSGKGYANVLVPQSPSFNAKSGTWTFKYILGDSVKLSLRTGSVSTSTTIVVQPYITGTTWSAEDLSDALSVMSSIYSANGITLNINSTITIADSQYAVVSRDFTDATTSTLVSLGSTEAVNLFFIEDFVGSNILGIAAGMPGSMGIANAWNGVLNNLTAHASGNTLNNQLLGETAAHEMGHHLGLFHTTEPNGTTFDILSDTAECSRSSRDNDSDGEMSAEECEGFGAENVMFWTPWSSYSRSAGKKQEKFSSHQLQVLKYSPIAK